MKRYLFAVLSIGIILFSGCSPAGKETSKDIVNGNVQPGTTQTTTESMDTKPSSTGLQAKEGDEPKASGNTIGNDNTKTLLVLYYQDGQGYVIPVTRKVGKQEGPAKAALQGLVDNDLNREEIAYYGIYPVLPTGTQIQGINLKNGTAVVDFNKNILNYKDKSAEKNIVAAIVYTLTEFKTINNVRILVNGYDQKTLKYGTNISGELNRNNVLINSTKANLDPHMSKYDIYLFRNANDKYSYLLPVSLESADISSNVLPGMIVQAFSKDWTKQKLYSEIPSGTKLIGETAKDGLLTLNFNSQMRNYGGTAKEEGIIKQILFSSKQINGVNKVKILVEGKENSLPEGTETLKGLEIPSEINSVIDVK